MASWKLRGRFVQIPVINCITLPVLQVTLAHRFGTIRKHGTKRYVCIIQYLGSVSPSPRTVPVVFHLLSFLLVYNEYLECCPTKCRDL